MDQTEVVNRRLELQGGHGVRHHGHPLDMSRDEAIRDAALDLLAEIGYDRLTMDAVAARAHASKATIYRRWQGKASLVVDALNCSKGSMNEPDTGSLAGDFAVLGQGACSQESRFNAKVMLGLITALAHDAELRHVVQERLIEPRTAVIRTIFERAIARGEVSPERNLDLLVTLFPALMIQQVLIKGEMPDADFSDHVINDVILPLATASTTPFNS
ncbi:MAG: TetR/AcrR family transcriptional regulator [Acidimicrobiales bacterium]